MRYFFLLFILIRVSSTDSSVLAQAGLIRVDSINRYTLSYPNDSAALSALNSELIKIYTDNSDTAVYYARLQVAMAREGGWSSLEAKGLWMVGLSLEFSGALDSAINYYKKARFIGEKIHDSTVLLRAHNSLGRVYSSKGLYQLSIEETLKAVELAAESRDTRQNASMLNSLGLRFNELDRYTQAIVFFRRALKLNEELKDTFWITANNTNIGATYHAKNMGDSCRFYFYKALAITRLSANRFQRLAAFSGLARSYYSINKLDSAQWAKDSMEAIAFEVNEAYHIHEADMIQGNIYLKVGRYREAIAFLETALRWFKEAEYLSITTGILESLSAAYDLAGEDEVSLRYLKQMIALKDKINLEQKNLAMEQVDIYREQRQEKARDLLNEQIDFKAQELDHQTYLRNLFFLLGLIMLVLLAVSTNRYLYERKTKVMLADKSKIIELEKDRSNSLLLNILPVHVAEELKDKGRSEPRYFDRVTVLFTDFVSFTELAQNLSAQELVTEIDLYFKRFDQIVTKYKIEKIKTIGDAYMAAGGLPIPCADSVKNTVLAALEMQVFIDARKKTQDAKQKSGFEMRVGIHSGPVVAGIVGLNKFQYDIWGDTVNTASRMESSGESGKVNISHSTYELLKGDQDFEFESRGKIAAKGKGDVEMWYVSTKN